MRTLRRAWRAPATLSIALGSACVPLAGAADEPPPVAATALETVNVVGVAPAPGGELPENKLPYTVQRADAGDFATAQALDATEYLERHAASISINSAQANPLQPDVQFRGFTASPLLGGAQGVSVYVDGVRVNEVFGDTVNWDLIPEEAMSRLSLLSGANPVFGLNTLGGAIQIQTKTGFSDPGTEIETDAGSFGRSETTLASGGNDGRWGWYALANHFEESGWRDLSNSNASTFLGTASWHGDAASVDLHLSHAETKLTGDGPQSIALLPLAPRSVFTAPDRTQNSFDGVTAQGTYAANADVSLSATVFTRRVDTRSFNGDATDFVACDGDPTVLCDAGGVPLRDQSGNPVATRFDAIDNASVRRQRSDGGSLQGIFKQELLGRKNQFVVGIDIDRGRVDYASSVEAATLRRFAAYTVETTPDSGIFLPDQALAVRVHENTAGVYATDTWSLSDAFALTVSARGNRTRTRIADAGSGNPGLDGAHAFHRLNPAVGFTYQFNPALNFYAGYSESTRAPTPVELTCASAGAPCKLPNEFLADPELRQVVARSIEAGLRGHLDTPWSGSTQWQAGVFRTVNAHDIVFQTTGGALSNEGFFANVGATRRQGVELSFKGHAAERRLEWSANVTRLDATFRTPFDEISAHHPFADPASGRIAVARGDRLPGVPRDTLKIAADWHLTPAFSAGGDLVYNSARFLRGDEANRLAPLGGYATLNLHARWRVLEHAALFARVQNLFDRNDANFGVLGDATTLYPDTTDPRFVSPGAPRAGWVGATLDW